jgi:AraC-like DNA-binding protein
MQPPRGIKTGHYSTAGLPPADRHELWANRGWPSVAALFDSTPIGEFETSADSVVLDGIPVSYAQGTARQLERSPARIAADQMNVLGISAILDGTMEGVAAERAFLAGPGEILLLDMAQTSSVLLSRSRSVQIAVPRSLAEAELGRVAALHGAVIGKDAAAMLLSHLGQLSERLQRIPERDAARVARTLLDMLALSVRSIDHAEEDDEAAQALSVRARGEIERNLGSTSLSAASLCRRLDISRSTLHRLFEDEGGVQAYIRNRRLEAARTALLTPGNAERIGDIAERLGFSDSAHLSRLFRRRYGESPSECRTRRPSEGV